MGKSFFEKRPVFSIRKLSVGACSVVIGISALGLSRVHAEEKPALESEPTSMETPSVVTENSETEVPEAGARAVSYTHLDVYKRQIQTVLSLTR